MNFNNANALLTDNAYSVQLKFYKDNGANIGKVYDYLCDIPGVKVGDDVIVMAPNFDTNAPDAIPKVCKVVSVDTEITVDLMVEFEYKWIVQVVDYTAANLRKAAADELAKKLTAAKRNKMRAQLTAAMLNELGIDIVALKG